MRRPQQLLRLSLIAMTLVVSMTGCASGRRVVLVNSDKSVFRAGPNLKGRIYIKNEKGEWELSRNKIQIPEGYFIGSGN